MKDLRFSLLLVCSDGHVKLVTALVKVHWGGCVINLYSQTKGD